MILSGQWETAALYRKNLQGDITGVIDATSGQLLVEYSYDAYGNVEILSNNDAGAALLGAIFTVYNPLLYRGYAYSILGGSLAYYLGSRFYMPQLGRFLNADKHTDTDTGVIGTNMYAYCNNNPVMFVDPTGEALRSLNIIVKIVNAIKKIVHNVNANSISKKGLELAPMSNHIKSMKSKKVTYSFSEKFELYQVSTYYSTRTLYSNEEYYIFTVSTSVKNWYKLIDEIRSYTSVYGVIGVLQTIIGNGIKLAEATEIIAAAGYTIPSFISKLSTIAAAIGIPVAILIQAIDSTTDGIEYMLRGKSLSKTFTFNVEVTKSYWATGMSAHNKEVLHSILKLW